MLPCILVPPCDHHHALLPVLAFKCMEAQGFVSKTQRLAKADSIIRQGASLLDGMIILSNKLRKMKPLNPHSFVTLPPDNPGISARAVVSLLRRAISRR